MTELAVIQPGSYFSDSQLDLLKTQICPGATDGELALFTAICQRTGLDPFSRQIYAIQRWDNKANRYKMVIQTGIDGYRQIADRQANYAGSDEPLFNDGLTEYQMRASGQKLPVTASVTVYKLIAGVRCPFTATAAWESYYPGDKQGQMWLKFPYLMLAKCAEALALRKGWAAHMQGVYVQEEMQQADVDDAEYESPEDRAKRSKEYREAAKTAPPKPREPASEAVKLVAQQKLDAARDAAADVKGETRKDVRLLMTGDGSTQVDDPGCKDQVRFIVLVGSKRKCIIYYSPVNFGERLAAAGYPGVALQPHKHEGYITVDLTSAPQPDGTFIYTATNLRVEPAKAEVPAPEPADDLGPATTVEELMAEQAAKGK